MEYHIGINAGANKVDVLCIGYTKEGGFFVQDLHSANSMAYVAKTKVLAGNPGVQHGSVDKSNEWVAYDLPKLTHHADGHAHVSGSGIVSGFYKLTGKPKGVHVDSMKLARNDNDGGPIFGATIWGLEGFNLQKELSSISFDESQISIRINNGLPHEGYVIEGYYFSKSEEKFIEPITNTILKQHPNFGEWRLKVVRSLDKSPGFLALGCFKITHGYEEKSGIVIGGAPGFVRDGQYEMIWIMRPALSSVFNKSNLKSLKFTKLYRQLCIIESKIYGFLKNVANLFIAFKFVNTPVFIVKYILRFKFKKGIFTDKDVKNTFKLIHILYPDIVNFSVVNFYTNYIYTHGGGKVVAHMFSELNNETHSPIRGKKNNIENALTKICSVDKLKVQLHQMFKETAIDIDIESINKFAIALINYLKHNPIIVQTIPEAIIGTNIKMFVISSYSPIQVPYDALYCLTYLFSSDFPLSIVVEGSII